VFQIQRFIDLFSSVREIEKVKLFLGGLVERLFTSLRDVARVRNCDLVTFIFFVNTALSL